MTGSLLPEDLDQLLATEPVPIRPAPYRPELSTTAAHGGSVVPVSPEQAARNRAILLASLSERRAA